MTIAQQGRGRKPQHDADTEIALLMRAAIKVMQRKDYAAVTVTDILREAGLFTRAFYRHFDSKDALLVGMYRLDATVVVGRLRERIAAAPSARAALEAYIDEYLSLWWDPRKSKRAGILASASARQASGFGEAERISRAELAAPLREVLEAGVASQVFATPSAERDAATICSILWNMRPSTEKKETYGRDRAKADVMRFVLPALGLPE